MRCKSDEVREVMLDVTFFFFFLHGQILSFCIAVVIRWLVYIPRFTLYAWVKLVGTFLPSYTCYI